jgi:hypothetical protein
MKMAMAITLTLICYTPVVAAIAYSRALLIAIKLKHYPDKTKLSLKSLINLTEAIIFL